MKLSCALVLALTNLVIATPFSFSLKGSGSSSKVDPSAATFGTFGLVQPVGSSTGYSGTFSKSSSANFAASSASESSGSFSYNAAQGKPSVAYNTVPSVGVTGQVVGQNVAVTPQAFTTAVPVIHNTGSSEDAGAQAYYFSKEVKNVSPLANVPSAVQPENQPDISIGNPHAFVSQDNTKPNAFVSAGSTLDSGISGSLSSQYVSSNPVNANTASNLPAGQQPGIYLGSPTYVSETQGNLKPNSLVSGSPAYTTVSDTSYNQEVHGVQGVQVNTGTTWQLQDKLVATEQKPTIYLGSNTQTPVSQDISNSNVVVSNVATKESEKNKEWSTVHGVSSSVVNSGAVVSPLTTQTQVTPTVEKKPVYSSGFGGPPGVLSPYDKPVSGFDIASNLNTQQNAQLSELVSPTPQVFSYTPVNNPKPSYAFQQQQTLTVQPEQSSASGANYFTSTVESTYKPEIKPTSQKENIPVSVNTNEKPLSELKPSNYVQTSVAQDVYQKPEVESPKTPEIVVEYPSQTIKPGYQISIQAYPSKQTSQTVPESELVEKVEQSKKPLYTGGFGGPAGILEPIKPTVNEVHNFAFSTVKPQQYEESKTTVGYTPTVTNVNKYSSISEEVNPTEKPYIETASYQPNVGSSPASYVTFKPTGSVSYSEQDTSSFVSSTAAPVGVIGQKGEGQILSKPYDTIPVKPTFSTWGQNPTQASVLLVQKPEIVEPVKPAVQVSSPSEPIFSKTPETFTTAQPPTYQFEGKNPTTSVPVKYEPSNVLVVKDEIKPYSEAVSTNQYESSQSGAVVNQIEVEKQSYQVYPTVSSSISSTVASSYKPEQTFVPFDQTKPTGTVVITSQKEGSTVSDVKVPNLTENNISPVFGEVKPTVPQSSAVYSTPGFVSVSQQPTNKPSFEGSSEKIPAFAFSGNPLTIPHANKPSTLYIEQKDTQKLNSEVINTSTPSKVPVLVSNTYSEKIETQFPKKPTVTNPDKPSYSSSFGTLTGSTGYISSSYGQESTIVTGSKDKVSQINFGTTVKPFVKPELSTLPQQTVVQTDAVSQSAQKQTGSAFVQNKPSVVPSEGQKPITQVFTTNSAVSGSTTASGSKVQYQLPTIQPTVQKNPWYTNSFGAFSTPKPYNNFYPGFTSSVTTYGQDLSQDKTKQTTQITSPGQYTSFSSGQYQPYTTGQYKPYNWGFNGYSSYPKYSNVYPTGGTFVSTYAPTTFKPFVTSSPFEKSKTSSIFPVTDKKESTYVSAFGSPLSVTTAKPSSLIQTQTSYKPVQELEKPKVATVVVPPKYEAPVSKPIETQPKKTSFFSVNSGSLGTSSFGQSSFSSVKPTANLLTSSAQSEVNLETVKPSTQLPSKVVEVNTNNESGLTDKVSKLPESSFTSVPVSHVTPPIQKKPSSDLNVASVVIKPSSSFAPQIKVDEKVQPSQTLKPEWSSELNHKESSVGVGVTPNGLKPTEQPYLGTTSYFINKEVKPTQVSAITPSSTFTLNTVSASKGDEKIQYNQTPKPEWSSPVSNPKEPSVAVSVGETSESIKPIPFHGTNSYYFNKEVTPTEISAIKPSSYGTFTVDTSSQNKVDEKVQFIQTSKPLWSSNEKVASDSSKPEWSSPVSNQKEPSVAVSVGQTSESIKPIPFHGTNSYYFNKEVTPTEISATKPSSYGTFTVDTSSQNKVDEKVQFIQTSKPLWASNEKVASDSSKPEVSSPVSNQKEPSVAVSVGETSESIKPIPFHGTNSYYFNKEVTPTEVSAIKPSSYGTFTVDTSSQNKVDEKVQFIQTSKPLWASNEKVASDSSKPEVSSPVSNQKEPSVAVSVGEKSESIKPIPFHGTNSYYFTKEVTPTEISATKPSSYGTFTVDTSSQNKVDEKVQYIQTSKPVWSSNQKPASDSSKPTVQPLGTSFYSTINKVATPIQVDDKKPLTSGTSSTGLVTGNTNVGSVPSVASSGNGNSGIHLSSVEKWSATATPVVTQKPENSFEQSSGSKVTPKPLAATGNVQYISQVTTGKPVFSKPISQISAVEKKPAPVLSYKEKDTKEGSVVTTVVKPTVPSEYTTSVKVTSKYTDVPAKVPTSFVQSTQIPAQTNQQTWGFNSNTGASQSIQTSYVGGFGGPPGILKPNEGQQQYVHTQYKPSYNNQYAWTNNQNRQTGYNYNTGSYFGRFGAPSGVWSTNEYVKPSGFGYVHNANKWQKNVNQHAVFQSQASAGTPSNVAVNPTTAGFVSGHHHIQNPFSGSVSTGTGLTSNDFKLTGQVSGTKVLGTPQGTPSTSVSYKTVGPAVFASLL